MRARFGDVQNKKKIHETTVSARKIYYVSR